jgi:UDP-N-acetylmuramoylalanine--D-glutamate ligase
VLVVGLGESGYAAAQFLLCRGASLRCTDRAISGSVEKRRQRLEVLGAEVEWGRHTEVFCQGCELVVVSPGVDPASLPLRWAEARSVPIISEIELAYRFCRSPIMAVTGTNGKTTTCGLMTAMLTSGGWDAAAAGNIGLPLIQKVADPQTPEVLVVEVSSFQLERIHEFRPFVSVVLNVTQDHLDRYASFEEYVAAKRRIAENQVAGDCFIVNQAVRHLFPIVGSPDVPCVHTLGWERGADLLCREGRVISRLSGTEKCYEVHSHWRLRGDHNLENVAAAIGVAEIFGVGESAIYTALSGFGALDHRVQFVDEISGVGFYDDSKGTNVDATVKAIRSLTGPVILIAGGRDKGGEYTSLREAARGKVRLAVLMGEAKERLMASLRDAVPVVVASDMDAAVEIAFRESQCGDVVLLSPACSSFDMFANYKERGRAFQAKVLELKPRTGEGRRNHEAA